MADPAAFVIDTMTLPQVELAVKWAAREGWNPGLHDAACFYAADPEGFLVGLLDGEPVATISAVRYGQTFGFVGFYIVHPDHRGKGLGLKIWETAMTRLAGRVVGLDGVVAQQHNYCKSGFKLAGRNIRFEGRNLADSFSPPASVVPLDRLPLQAVLAYDRAFFPEPRDVFVRAWIQQPGAWGLGLWEQDRLRGYGVLRPCLSGYKIGPLFADDPARADVLFQSLCARVKAHEPIYLDTPQANPAAVELANRYGMQPMFETARMYLGRQPDVSVDRTFGVTSFELG